MTIVRNKLRGVGLRPTEQRIAILELLFENENVHVSAALVNEKLIRKNKHISLATIYNSLNEFEKKGILKKVLVDKEKMWFDTNLEHHHHFYDEEKDLLTDISEKEITFSKFPKLPQGKSIKSLNIIVKVKSTSN